MFYNVLSLYFHALDLTKTKVFLNLGSKRFCDSVLGVHEILQNVLAQN